MGNKPFGLASSHTQYLIQLQEKKKTKKPKTKTQKIDKTKQNKLNNKNKIKMKPMCTMILNS